MTDGLHEDLRRQNEVKRGSDRGFGITFAVVFLLIGLLPLRHGLPPRWWALLNRLWARFGDLLHKITTPLVMGLLFFGALAPFAVVLRLVGKDPLRLKRDPNATSYWIERRPPGPAPDSLNQAF